MAKDDELVVLRSYTTAWRYEKRLYSIDSLKLWVPLVANDVIFFALGLVLMYILSKVPMFTAIPWVIRYGLLPFLIMKFFTKMKFDGKLPHKFAVGYLGYMMLPAYLSRFQGYRSYTEGCFQNMLFRRTEIINLIELRLHDTGKERKTRRLKK